MGRHDLFWLKSPLPILVADFREYKEGIQEIFQTSINWFLKNLWHDASEEPESSTARLLGITKDDEVKMMCSTHEKEYEGDTEGYWLFHDEEGNTYNPFYGEVKKWLYIEDLMKGGE